MAYPFIHHDRTVRDTLDRAARLRPAASSPDLALLSMAPDYERLERQISTLREREDYAAAGALFPPLQALIEHAATLRASTLEGLRFKSRMALFCRFPDDDDDLLESIARDLLAMEGGL